jgi:hypothetical protein
MLMTLIYLTERHTIKKNTESLIVACEETGIEVKARKTMYLTMFRDQNAGRSHSIMIDNKSLDREYRRVLIF